MPRARHPVHRSEATVIKQVRAFMECLPSLVSVGHEKGVIFYSATRAACLAVPVLAVVSVALLVLIFWSRIEAYSVKRRALR